MLNRQISRAAIRPDKPISVPLITASGFLKSQHHYCIAALRAAVPATDRTYELPCDVTSFAQSGDGTVIWVACNDRSLWKRWQSDVKETREKGIAPPPRPVTSHARTVVYVLEVQSGRVSEIQDAEGPIYIVAAPVGAKAVLILPQDRGHGRPILFDGSQRVAELPIDPSFLIWSADASKIYFYGGSTIEADAWNILGVLRLDNLTISREKLLEPTESVHICAATGHLFTGDPIPNDKGQLEANAVEYDSDVKSGRRITKFPSGNFSASCRYVATEHSYHGPLPWEIVDVTTGAHLVLFDFTGEGKKEEFEFRSWNPKRENILVRALIPPITGEAEAPHLVLQVFDLSERRVLESLPDFSGPVEWTQDGRTLILSRAKSIVFHRVFAEN